MLSPNSARRAEQLGYTKVKIFHDGLPAWKKGGNIVVAEPASLKDYIEKDIAHILVDLRSAGSAEKGFIQGAVSIPAKDLASTKEKFPADKSAPVVLYGDGMIDDAFRIVRGWGYPNVAELRGGVEAWKQAGGQLASGNPATEIVYAPKPRPGEISIEEFKTVAEKGSSDKVILDVRDVDESMNGMIKGALNIPASQIKSRLSDIPKDKEIITHCVTGIRAESAYDDLKESGYRVRFLNAVIQIDKDGKYEITKK
jgi:rhodanese-related sulfurtransferase